MAILARTTRFQNVPANCTFETFVQLTSGSVQCSFTFSNHSTPIAGTPWDNSIVLRSTANPNAAGRVPMLGPVACVLFAEIIVTSNGTAGLVVIRALDAQGTEIRRQAWDLHNGANALSNGDAVNGLHLIQLA